MQDLPRLGGRGGRVGVDELGKTCDEVPRNLDADSDSITVTDGRKRLLNLPTQMQCDPIRGLGRVQWSSWAVATLEGVEMCPQRFSDKYLVDPRTHLRHMSTLRPGQTQ